VIPPEQAAELVLRLCSPSAAQVTGQVIFADGSLALC
jgi:NAD(P)-dependent dehydrogenase (short-subunit alcohol dehydrogenase family)